MNRIQLAIAPALLLGLASVGCARFQPYAASPLPVPAVEGFLHRSLRDPALEEFLTAQGASVQSSGWTPDQLALAAVYLNPTLAEGAGEVGAAEAAEITAGTPPELTASAEISRAARVDEGKSSAWSFSLVAGLTVETGGKRDARRARARARTALARLRLESAARHVATTATLAATRAINAGEEVVDARGERTTLAEVATLVRARYAEGRVSLADVAQAEQEVRTAALGTAQVARARTEARLELARALTLPLRAVDSIALDPGAAAGCSSRRLGFDSLGADALRRRADVAAAVAAYAVAEAELRIEIARQYPDLTIGPGIAWDQGIMRWLLSVGTPGVLRTLNRGPIAEARARRAIEAARVEIVQDSVLAAVDAAIAGCRDLASEIDAAGASARSAADALGIVQRAYARGEIGRTEVVFAELAVVRASRALHAAQRRERDASAMLGAVSGRWTAEASRWPDVMTLPRVRSTLAPSQP